MITKPSEWSSNASIFILKPCTWFSMPSIGLHASACSKTPQIMPLSFSLNFFIRYLITGPTETRIGSLWASFHAFELVPSLPSSEKETVTIQMKSFVPFLYRIYPFKSNPNFFCLIHNIKPNLHNSSRETFKKAREARLFIQSMPVSHWVLPPSGKLKLNPDAFLDLNGGFTGLGITIWDCAGKVVVAASIWKVGALSVCVVEAFIGSPWRSKTT